MVGFCKLCEKPGAVHRKYKVCLECWSDRKVRSQVMNRPDSELDRDDISGPVPLDTTPTKFPPGSPGKVGVLEGRQNRKVALFHPCDARTWGDTLPDEFMSATDEKKSDMLIRFDRIKKEKERIFAVSG